jgi:RNA polymerase sigma-70 factor, ECF subfamily
LRIKGRACNVSPSTDEHTDKGPRVQTPLDELDRSMRAALMGDAAAYRRALNLLTPLLRATVRAGLARCGRGPDAVEDIVQESLLAVHVKRATWDPAQPVAPWARAIAKYKLIDFLRRKGERAHVDIAEMADTLPEPEAPAADGVFAAQMAMTRLAPRDREIVESIAIQGSSARETGDRLGLSEGAVRVALHRALKSLAILCRSIER